MAKNNYLVAACWFILHVLFSSSNDCLATMLGQNLPSFEIVFLRFLFGIITLLPFLMKGGIESFKTSRIEIHILRGALLFSGIAIWVICLSEVKMVMITIMGFSIPIFFIILAYFLLNEKIGLRRLLVAIIGFIGIIIVLDPTGLDFKPISFLLLIAVIAFALLDIINKKFVSKESFINMIFYSSLFTCMFAAIPTFYQGFVMPNAKQILLCAALGAGANLLLYALLKSFALAEASSLAPLRYLELLFTSSLGYIFFGQIPHQSIYIGAFIIISCNLLLIYFEKSQKIA
jgi:S-adenosylmethionine uptake transporter